MRKTNSKMQYILLEPTAPPPPSLWALKSEVYCPAFIINFGEENKAFDAFVNDLNYLIKDAKVGQGVRRH
jgi:hypothetical protein